MLNSLHLKRSEDCNLNHQEHIKLTCKKSRSFPLMYDIYELWQVISKFLVYYYKSCPFGLYVNKTRN
jgi:hypothetical protein